MAEKESMRHKFTDFRLIPKTPGRLALIFASTMRTALQNIDDERASFTGVFAKYGLKTSFKGPSTSTILLVNIKDAGGVVVCDHLWFNVTKGFENIGALVKGDTIGFDARVKRYRKGYVNQRIKIDQSTFDYKLSHPTRIRKIAP